MTNNITINFKGSFIESIDRVCMIHGLEQKFNYRTGELHLIDAQKNCYIVTDNILLELEQGKDTIIRRK